MATAPLLDFDAFVAKRKTDRSVANGRDITAGAPGTGEHDYSFVLDRQTRATFESAKPVELAVSSAVRMFKERERGRLLGSAVKVSDRQFPRLRSIVRECAETLGIAEPQVYLVSNVTLNAGTFGTRDESFIVVHSGLVEQYSDDELRFVLGHECGHIHNSHVVYLTTLHLLKVVAEAHLGALVMPAMLPLNAWSRRAEITCDRAGMLCANDVQVAARALTKLVVGSRRLYEEFDLDAFLEQHEEGKTSLGRYMEAFASHPFLPKRVLAMRVFASSKLYRSHRRANQSAAPISAESPSGKSLTMAEVDAKVEKLLNGKA